MAYLLRRSQATAAINKPSKEDRIISRLPTRLPKTQTQLILSSKHRFITKYEEIHDLNIIDLIMVQATVLRSKRIALNQEQW
jgi:hypothetical protein